MTQQSSIRALLSGVGASLTSFLGICCMGGACAVACGAACVTPIASVLGVSVAGLSSWASAWLPIFTAMSAVAFTVAYFAIYRQPTDSCCEDKGVATNRFTASRWAKPAFWGSLVLTIGLYAQTLLAGPTNEAATTACATSCSPDETTCGANTECKTEHTAQLSDSPSCTPKND